VHLHANHAVTVAKRKVDGRDAAAALRRELLKRREGIRLGLETDDVCARKEREGLFGELSAIDRAPRSAGVEAIERSTIASLTATQFETLLLADPVVAVATIRHVTGEVRRLSERVFEFSTLVVQNRIHAELLRLAADVRQENGQALLSPAPSLSDIANRISTHREAVSRELSRLASIGLLRREGGDLRVSDLARLTKLVREARRE